MGKTRQDERVRMVYITGRSSRGEESSTLLFRKKRREKRERRGDTIDKSEIFHIPSHAAEE
jgi:hypothetical protein